MPQDELLFENEFVSTYLRDGWYVYTEESRTQDSQIVCVLPFTLRKEEDNGALDKLLGRFERNPAHDDGIALCAITGGVDHGDKPEEAAIKELWEEGGFALEADALIPLGTMRPLASSNATVHLYAVDVTGMEDIREEKPPGDGTIGEEDAYCDWITWEDAVGCKSANMMSAVLRLTAELTKDLREQNK